MIDSLFSQPSSFFYQLIYFLVGILQSSPLLQLGHVKHPPPLSLYSFIFYTHIFLASSSSRLHLQLKFTFCDSFPFKVKTVSAMASEFHALKDIPRVVRQYLPRQSSASKDSFHSLQKFQRFQRENCYFMFQAQKKTKSIKLEM